MFLSLTTNFHFACAVAWLAKAATSELSTSSLGLKTRKMEGLTASLDSSIPFVVVQIETSPIDGTNNISFEVLPLRVELVII